MPSPVVSLLVEWLRRVIDDLRQRAASVDGEWRPLLSDVAADLEAQVDGL